MTTPRGATGIHAGWGRSPPPAAPPATGARAVATRGLRRCRVEHRRAGATAVLARGLLARPHPAELVPFASWLRLEGLAGEVVLVEEASGADLARRAVRAA